MLKKNNTYLIYLLTCLLLLGGFSVKAQVAKKDTTKAVTEEVLFDANASHKNGLYSDDQSVGYKVKLKSTYKEKQDGTLTYDVSTDDGKLISTNSLPLHLTYNSGEDFSLNIPKQSAGFYKLDIRINTTSNDDTVRKVFGVSPEKISSTLHRPEDLMIFGKAH